MADIELVIKIPEEVYKKAKETHDVMCDSVWLGIKNSIQLTKGHGRLIDADKLKEVYENTEDAEYCKWTLYGVTSEIDDATTIIEADTAEKLKNMRDNFKERRENERNE